jgi:hypothetical protein
MDKIKDLQKRAKEFRLLLERYSGEDPDASLLLETLASLFDDIASGKVVPPVQYKYVLALGKDSPFYEPDGPFISSETAFMSALEDWKFQSWYKPS